MVFEKVLFPGRHHLVTSYQVHYLKRLLANGCYDTKGEKVLLKENASVLWAVTSATHSGTRRNPLDVSRRESLIETVALVEGIPSLVAPVADMAPSERFAEITINSVEFSLGEEITPSNTVVACSTLEVAALYEKLGYRIVGMENEEGALTPWQVITKLAEEDDAWVEYAHPQTVSFYRKYKLEDLIRTSYNDPTVSSEGDLTSTRNYQVYSESFDSGSDRKWKQIAPYVQPGKIVDFGCAAGGLLERVAREPKLNESDLYGVDVSRYLIAEAEHRKAQGAFENPNIFFLQRNLLINPVFKPGTMNTTTTVALTHEISSYGEGEKDLQVLAERIFEHTAPGGVWINSDVVGPQDPEKLVVLSMEGKRTGEIADYENWTNDQVSAHYSSLTTAEKFEHFAYFFPRLSGGSFPHQWVSSNQVQTSFANALEFLYTRDYVNNFLSECHEKFTTMNWAKWEKLLLKTGFEILPASGPWVNQWLVENRLSKEVRITTPAGEEVPWAETHVLFVARKP